jgi:hypothetical protein
MVDSFGLFFGDFCMDLYSFDSDETMKRGDETLNASSLQFSSIIERFIASLLQFFLSIKRFLAFNFYGKTSFNATSLLFFKRNSSLNASLTLLFKVTLPTCSGVVDWLLMSLAQKGNFPHLEVFTQKTV